MGLFTISISDTECFDQRRGDQLISAPWAGGRDLETEELENSSAWKGGTQMNIHSKSVAPLHYLRKRELDDKSLYVMK